MSGSQIAVYILNGLFVAGIIAGVIMGKIDTTTAVALIGALLTPSAAHVALNAKKDGDK